MTNSKKTEIKIADPHYDVKEEIGEEIMQWLIENHVHTELLGSDWKSLDPLQKICLYWLMYYICDDSKIKNFDCDSSAYAKSILGMMPGMKETMNVAPYMDTMTSAWSPVKKYLGLNKCKREGCEMLLSSDAKDYKERLCDIGAMDFLRANHTIGNFIPVPRYFNKCRSGYSGPPNYLAEYDQADLMLLHMYNYYKYREACNDVSEPARKKDIHALRPLFLFRNNAGAAIDNTKIWLDHFGSWERFIKENCLESMVECDDAGKGEFGPPIMLFPGHSLEKPYPENEGEWRMWFQIATKLIVARSLDIANYCNGTVAVKSSQ